MSITPRPELLGIIEKIWVLDIKGSLPSNDAKNIIPDGHAKLIIPYRNGLSSRKGDFTYRADEGTLTLVGITNTPAASDKSGSLDTGMIVIQLLPEGWYRLFNTDFTYIRDRIAPLRDLLGATARQIEEQIANDPIIERKIARIQNYFISHLSCTSSDSTLDFCIRRIRQTHGKCRITELERLTGYSSRWLTAKFNEKVGMSPKNLAALMRFNQVYSLWVRGKSNHKFMMNILDFYYDQSHFLHEFKRFAGMSPTRLEKVRNEFGNLFYS